MTDDELRLRPTRLNGDPPAPDDFEVFWRDIPIGRILKQPGTPIRKPNWFWGINLPNKPQPAYHRGICSGIEECKRRFMVAWSGVRPTLTEGELTIMRRHLADLERRSAGRERNIPIELESAISCVGVPVCVSPVGHHLSCRNVYLVLDCFERNGCAWREADAGDTDLETVIRDMMSGQYNDPQRGGRLQYLRALGRRCFRRRCARDPAPCRQPA